MHRSNLVMIRPALLAPAIAAAPICLGADLHIPADFPTIQSAVDAAASGDTIIIAPGTYAESIIIPPMSITLKGASGDPADTIIDASSIGPARVITADWPAPVEHSLTLEGLTITGGEVSGLEDGGGLLANNAIVSIVGCNITDNLDVFTMDPPGQANRGAFSGAGGSWMLDDCTVSNNSAMGGLNSVSLAMSGCDFTTNNSFLVLFQGTAMIEGSTFTDNAAGIRPVAGAALTLVGCTLTGAAGSPCISSISSFAIEAIDCDFIGGSAGTPGAIRTQVGSATSSASFVNCTFSEIEATRVLYLDAADVDIVDCTFSKNGWVADITAMRTAVTGCVLNGNIPPASQLGLSINVDGSPSDPTRAVTISGCDFTGNAFSNALSIEGWLNSVHSTRVIDCSFTGNTAPIAGATLAISLGTSAEVRGCAFSNNSGYPSSCSFFEMNGTMIIESCEFRGNNYASYPISLPVGALQLQQATDDINGNNHTVNNCLFTDNTGVDDTPGIAMLGTNAHITNCTIVRNTITGGDGPGIAGDDSSALIENCIIRDNTDSGSSPQILFTGTSTVETRYSNIENGPAGEGDFDADPIFADPLGADGIPGSDDDDFRLAPGSPCIDAGDNSAVPADALDLDGDEDTAEPTPLDLDSAARFIDDPSTADTGLGSPPVVDLGAYEFQPAPPPACPADLDGDGSITSTDLNILLAAFGCSASPCSGDINNDGATTSADLNALLAVFGQSCSR